MITCMVTVIKDLWWEMAQNRAEASVECGFKAPGVARTSLQNCSRENLVLSAEQAEEPQSSLSGCSHCSRPREELVSVQW